MIFPILPITAHLDAIAEGVRDHTISILQAPPGSGKTTILPLHLLQQDWLAGRSILILQPRRLAAKSISARMSELLGESVGNTVGYQIRLESRKSSATRIEIITEGLLTRRILAEPELPGVGLIIFDEFHERSVNADLGLSLAQEVASVLRSDLKLLVMSATLDSLRDMPELSNAWRYSFESKPYPVDIRYVVPDPRKPIWEAISTVIRSTMHQHPGDLLAFLPGAFEIQRCREILERSNGQYKVLPLYGELTHEEQQLALRPLDNGLRKVVLATNIAETSLTIEGIRIVIDAGLQKVSRSSETGIATLKTESITRDAAEQRAGRAGRTGPGVCVRLWTEQEHCTLRPNREPEVLRADLTQQVLELAAWGIRCPADFPWITHPPKRAIDTAVTTLRNIGAIRDDGSITELGQMLVKLGTHPRIGACCIIAHAHDLDPYAAAIIPLLEERIFSSNKYRTTDITGSVETLVAGERVPGASTRIQQLQFVWLKRLRALKKERLPVEKRVPREAACGFLLATAFPERIARRRPGSRERYLLASGAGATLQAHDPLGSWEFIVVAEMQERPEDAHILRAAPLYPELLDNHLKHLLAEKTVSRFDPDIGTVTVHRNTMIDSISITHERLTDLTTEELQEGLLNYIRTPEGHLSLPFSSAAIALQARCAWARRSYPKSNIPDISSEVLRVINPHWLSGRVPKSGRLADISPSLIEQSLNDQLNWESRSELDELAPPTITLPGGKTKRIDYSEETGPTVECMIQEVFGLPDTPRIGRCQVPVTLKLLSPARRPMQVTRDLASFWRTGYASVRKELRGRYPKHKWPEDPTQRIDKS